MLKRTAYPLLSLFLLACNPSESPTELKWGHLDGQSLRPGAPQFLINQSPDDPYDVCLAAYLVDELPGIESELEAAVNVWAATIGRRIPVNLVVAEQERAQLSQSANQLMETYYENCPAATDLVVGLAPFNDATTGQTGASWTMRGQEIVSFQRYLFLRDMDLTPGRYAKRWLSLEALEGRSYSADELLTVLTNEQRIVFDPPATSLSLPVIVHEVGHIWGLCDQYAGVDNCNPQHSSPVKDESSIMAASGQLSKLYLTRDDRIGIRKLARREGFNQQWPETAALVAEDVEFEESDILYFALRNVEVSTNSYMLDFGVVTKESGGQLDIEYRKQGTDGDWRVIGSIPSTAAFNYPQYSYRIGASAGLEFRLALKLANDEVPKYQYAP